MKPKHRLPFLPGPAFRRFSLGLVLLGFLLTWRLPAHAQIQDENCFTRKFEWFAVARHFSMTVDFSWDSYSFYSKIPRVYAQYGVYSFEHPDHAIIPTVAAQLRALATKKRLSQRQSLDMTVAFVQQLKYVAEPGEYPKFPIETLADRGGDCEDVTILLSALLREMGIETRLINPPGHMALAVECADCEGIHFSSGGKKFYYVESTSPLFKIGQMPDQFLHAKGRIFPTNISKLAMEYIERATKPAQPKPVVYYVHAEDRQRSLHWGDQWWIAATTLETVHIGDKQKTNEYLNGIGNSRDDVLPPVAWAAKRRAENNK